MPLSRRKIINDPVYGFITVDNPLIHSIISHPYYQRLRRVHQMAFAHLVYPGAVHTRLHHSLGAYHLMCQAVNELKAKGVEITYAEEEAVKAAILLHDIGHGPFSHALENILLPGTNHEEIGLQIMQKMNIELNGKLSLAIDIFTGRYNKHFLHQLISSQLDVDRMDYLSRDSFFTGVSEGVISYDRILKMLVVHDGGLMIEEKGIYSVEKFLIARRLMYWQVYLHKTVLGAEKMLVKIIERVKEIFNIHSASLRVSAPLDYFFENFTGVMDDKALEQFCLLDDDDIIFGIKQWSRHSDTILRVLCTGLLNRKLFKCRLQSEPFEEYVIEEKRQKLAQALNISIQDAAYLAFTGEATNTTYRSADERINILFRDGTVKGVSQVDNALIDETISMPVKKFYICELVQ
ncbi:MAG TPA: HD domain-containing protein [Chitinophagaceae bacterium]|nr:HD domain-containing protein [Chitinophagaceae bacterium]